MIRNRFSCILLVVTMAVALSGFSAQAAKAVKKPAKTTTTAKPQSKKVTVMAGAAIALPSASKVKVRWVCPPLDAKVVEASSWYDVRFVVDSAGNPWFGVGSTTIINPAAQYRLAVEHLYNDIACLENGTFLVSTDSDLGFIAMPETPRTNYDKLPVVLFQPIAGLPIPNCKLFPGAGDCLYLTGRNAATEKYEVYMLRPEALPNSAARVREYVKVFSGTQEITAVAGDGKITYVAVERTLLKISGSTCAKVLVHPTDYIRGLAYSSQAGLFYTTNTGVFYMGPSGSLQVLAADEPRIYLQKGNLYVLFHKTMGVLAMDNIDGLKKCNLAIKEVPSTQSSDVKVTDIRFFEAGEVAPDYGDRVYAARFDKASTRFVYCQADLTNLLKGKRKHSQIVTMELIPPGETWGESQDVRFDFTTDVPGLAGWARFGQVNPGSHYPGQYTLKTSMNGVRIDERRFTVDGEPSVLETAFYKDTAKMWKLLDAGADPNEKAVDGRTPLIVAVQNGSLEIVRLLLDHKADVNAKNEDGETALMSASGSYDDNSAIVRLLLENGADPNVAGTNGETALHKAASSNNAATMRLLLERGANSNARDSQQDTPLLKVTLSLHGFQYQAKPEHIELLLSHGADVNAADKDGNTALYEAIRGSDVELVRTLVTHGADLNAIRKYSDGTQYTTLWNALLSYDMEYDRLAKGRLKEIVGILVNANAQMLSSEVRIAVGSSMIELLGRKRIFSILQNDIETIIPYNPTDPWLRKYVLSRIIGFSYYSIRDAKDASGFATARTYCQLAKERAVKWNMESDFPEIDHNLSILNAKIGSQ